MNEKIAYIIKEKLTGLSFVDKIAGLVRPVKINVIKDGVPVLKTFPIATDVDYELCNSGIYKDLIPDSKYVSILYFEDNGTNFNYLEKRWVSFTSRLTLVCWLNVKKMQECTKYTSSTEAILSILSQLPEHPFNLSAPDDIFREIRISSISEVIKSNLIFSRYSYDEINSQYLLYPFDYFALNMAVDYKVNLACVEELNMSPCTCC